MSEFGLKLKEYRRKAGLSISDLARMVEVDTSYISRLEGAERRPKHREFVLQLASALGLSVDEKNTLLRSAEFASLDIDAVLAAHPAVKLLADILDDAQIPQEEKNVIEMHLRQIQRRWRDQNKPNTGQ